MHLVFKFNSGGFYGQVSLEAWPPCQSMRSRAQCWGQGRVTRRPRWSLLWSWRGATLTGQYEHKQMLAMK